MRWKPPLFAGVLALLLGGCATPERAARWEPLFPEDGPPKGWVVRDWADVSKPGPPDAAWTVEGRVLRSAGARGNWLISEREYGDFELEFEFLLGERGNSGCALRAPMFGDPAFDGLELQMADFRYNPEAKPSELTGGLYRAVAPAYQVYRPTEWNRYQIRCLGDVVQVDLNGRRILDVNLNDHLTHVKRHDGRDAPPLKDRPRRGHLGFQELSRGDSHVQIRGARIRVLDAQR
ncbi:MAG: DUF1080 domain-containing protein [Verrucomicrobia bacterium]|jgi:hypothetical protein|nr:DUF1080 domain-containing protein [Verrucomicrobiota bacterium]